jgi:hypothetical protein
MTLAFIAGFVICVRPVLFLPVTASLTSEGNPTAATELSVSVGIGATARGAAVSGCLSRWVGVLGSALGPADLKPVVLLLSSGAAACGTIALMRLPELSTAPPERAALRERFTVLRQSFLSCFLPCVALWTSLLGAFAPFATGYFSQQWHVSRSHLGLIFFASQLAQLAGGLVVLLEERRFGLTRGIVIFQAATGALLTLTAGSAQPAWCIAFFRSFSAAQWIWHPASAFWLYPGYDRNGRSRMHPLSHVLSVHSRAVPDDCVLAHSRRVLYGLRKRSKARSSSALRFARTRMCREMVPAILGEKPCGAL